MRRICFLYYVYRLSTRGRFVYKGLLLSYDRPTDSLVARQRKKKGKRKKKGRYDVIVNVSSQRVVAFTGLPTDNQRNKIVLFPGVLRHLAHLLAGVVRLLCLRWSLSLKRSTWAGFHFLGGFETRVMPSSLLPPPPKKKKKRFGKQLT